MNKLIYLLGFLCFGFCSMAQELQLEILQSHLGGLTSVILPPHSNLLFSGGKDGQIYGWDTETGEKRLSFIGHSGAVEVFDFHAGQLISAGREEAIHVWNIQKVQLSTKLIGHKYYVESLSVCPTTGKLASGSRDNSIKLWDLNTGTQVSYLEGHQDNVLSVAFDPTGKMIASSGEDQNLRIWNLSNRQLINEMTGQYNIDQISFSPDGQYLVGMMKHKLLVWDVSTWKIKYQLRGHSALILAFQFRPSSSILTSVDAMGKVICWDISSGKLIRSFIPDSSPLSALAFSEDGKQLALGFQNGLIQLWDMSVLDQEN